MFITVVVTFMQGIYNYVPETNRGSGVYCVAAVLWLQYMVPVLLFAMLNVLYFYMNTFHSSVQCPTWLFSLVPCCRSFQIMLLRYFLNDFEVVPGAPSYYWYLSSSSSSSLS